MIVEQYYDILEIKSGASLGEIKQAYRQLAKQWHPDRYINNSLLKAQAEAKFKLINEAYTFLREYQPELPEKNDTEFIITQDTPESFYDMGVASAEKGRISEAIEAFSAAIRANPHHWQAYHYRALLREKLGLTFAAKSDWEKVAQIKANEFKVTNQDNISTKETIKSENSNLSLEFPEKSPPSQFKAAIASQYHCVQTLTQHRDRVTSVAIARDGRYLVTGSYDHTVKVWYLHSGQLIHAFEGHTQGVNCVSISRNGILVASGSSDHRIKLWNLATGKLVKTLGNWFTGHQNLISCLVLSFYHQKLITGSSDQNLKFWNLNTGKELGTLPGYIGKISALALSPDEKMFATVGLKPILRIRSTFDGKIIHSLPSNAGMYAVAFSPNSNLVAVGGSDRTIHVWDLTTGAQIYTLLGHKARISSLAFSPDQKTLISGSWDHTVKIWDITTGNKINTLKGHTDKVLSVAVSPDASIIVSGSSDRTVKIWEID